MLQHPPSASRGLRARRVAAYPAAAGRVRVRAPGTADAKATRVRKLPWLNLVLLGAILAAFALLALRGGGSPGVEVEVRDPRRGIDEIRVDVSGAVLEPGVFTVAPGDRVVDAVALAGGLAPDADRAAVNLARRLVDQDKVVVPRLGEGAALLDVNRASATELERLPGIGPVYARRVVEARERDGRFDSTDDLVARDVLPLHIYEGIRNLIDAR